MQGLCLHYTVEKDSRGLLGTRVESSVLFFYSRSNGKHHKHFLFKKNLTSEQHSANCICKTCLLSDPFRLTNVDFFREFCNNTLDARL